MNFRAVPVLVLILLAAVPAAYGEDVDIGKIFRDGHHDGTLVISSLDGRELYTHNEERARMRFVPAETFELPNTLIARQEGVVGDEKEIVIWDGTDKGSPACESDQTLPAAYQASCAWFDEEMARRVGTQKYAAYLAQIGYGNGRVGPETTDFWLEGDLRISAVGQIEFLKNIYTRKYPFGDPAYDLLRRLMVVEQTPSYTLRAKTGWARTIVPQVGWYVGFVENGGKVWFFAANIEISRPGDGDLPREITLKALRLKGII